MLKEKGFQFAEVTPEIKDDAGRAEAGAPHLQHRRRAEGQDPTIEFIGNKAISDGTLQQADEGEQAAKSGCCSFITGRGTYQETKFDEDAEKVIEYYRDHGYITRATSAQPELKVLERLRRTRRRAGSSCASRSPRATATRSATFDVAGNTVVKTEYLKPLFKLKPGEYYNEKTIRKGLEKAREVYGAGGYFEFTGYPDYKFRDDPNPTEPEAPDGAEGARRRRRRDGPPIVDVTMRMQEGKQYFVNRITFTGNTTTRDNVIRREMRLVEDGVFNTEALKYSVKRLNQLGYFKPLEGRQGRRRPEDAERRRTRSTSS